mgnify:CR=1 FL=1
MRVVLTIVGKDKVGITAKVSNALAEMNINIININQNIMQGFFNMVLIADMAEANVPIAEARDKMAALGVEIGVEIRLQSERNFQRNASYIGAVMLFNTDDILETTRMITQNKLDVLLSPWASAA